MTQEKALDIEARKKEVKPVEAKEEEFPDLKPSEDLPKKVGRPKKTTEENNQPVAAATEEKKVLPATTSELEKKAQE